MKVTTIGLGYIGLPTSGLIASNNIYVTGVDINQEIVNTVNRGEIHIIEPELDQIIKDVVQAGYLEASTSVKEGDVYLIVVPTPFKENFEPDISFVEKATTDIIPYLKENDLYIIESTSPVGTTDKMRDLIFSKRPELKDKIYIAYCPERVLPGNVVYELKNNDRVIGGVDIKSSEAAEKFYKLFVEGEFHLTNSKTAEMCKLVENSSRDVQLAFANELSFLCSKPEIDINVWELIELANKHPRVNILQPGCGVGGHCIAVDPYFIISQNRRETKLISSAREINNGKPDWCVEKILNRVESYQSEHGKIPNVALMGLAFKPDIDDLRQSPALEVAEKLSAKFKKQNILIVEPNISRHEVFELSDSLNATGLADIIVFLVAHNEFKLLEIPKDKIVFDFCGITNQST